MGLFPYDKLGIGLGIGKETAAVVLCDNCGKRISVAGIHPEMMERGEYQVSYFSCVHCGQVFQITTTDERQRQLIQRRAATAQKIRLAYGRRFRQETVDRWHREYDKLGKSLNRRASWLRAAGEEILSGKEITRKDGAENGAGKGGDRGGPAGSQGGVDGVQGD